MAVAIRELELSKVTEGGLRLGEVLREMRRTRGWTQRDVAERWGLTVDGYRPYEQGRRQLRWSQLPGLATVLEVDEIELARRLGMKTTSSADAPDPSVLGRDLAAIAASELAELLMELRSYTPEAWRELIETWRTQPGTRRH